METPGEIVRRGYDEAAERYATGRHHHDMAYLRRFTELLRSGAAVLDVGCGSGRPVDRWLVEHGYRVTGLDVSPRQIELARRNVQTMRSFLPPGGRS